MAERKLARKFYIKVCFSLGVTAAFFLGFIAIMLYIIKNFSDGKAVVVWILVELVFLAIIIWRIKEVIPYFYDLHTVRHKEYLIITGVVLKHKKYVDIGGDSTIITYNP